MKERPIIFSAPMVRAILEGRKTQTRRVAKQTAGGHLKIQGQNRRWHPADPDAVLACPYGQPGDRLWVRETHYVEPHPSKYGMTREMIPRTWDQAVAATGTIHYRADPGAEWAIDGRQWTPSIHMRREHSRITLEVTGVRVERLKDISEEDAADEGVEPPRCPECGYSRLDADIHMDHWLCDMPMPTTARESFGKLWESIHGPGSWDANPWVWVVEFARIDSASAAA